MTSPRLLLDAATRLAGVDTSLFERGNSLFVTGDMDRESFKAWTALLDEAGRLGITGTIVHGETSGAIVLDDFSDGAATLSARVVLEKPIVAGVAHFFTLEGLNAFLARASFDEVVVATAAQASPFESELTSFVPWVAPLTTLPATETSVFVNPRLMARDLVDHVVPDRLDCWMLRTPPAAKDPVYEAWVASASKRLIAALSNDVTSPHDDGTLFMVRLRGTRSVDVPVSSSERLSPPAFEELQNAARWVFSEATDVETRHILFTDALAREWYEQVTWQRGFPLFGPRALSSARNAYRRHLAETSSETLKSLDDLRKSLSDDIAKVTQQTRLTSGLWRDFAIVFTALAGRAALIVAGNPIADSLAIRALMYLAAAYALMSIAVTLVASARFDAVLKSNRAAWRDRLFAFLVPEELETLADRPLQDTGHIYRDTAVVVAIAYGVMIGFIVLSTLFLRVNSSPSAAGQGNASPSPLPRTTASSRPNAAHSPPALRSRNATRRL